MTNCAVFFLPASSIELLHIKLCARFATTKKWCYFKDGNASNHCAGHSINLKKITRQLLDTKAHSPKGKRFQNAKTAFVY